MIKPNELETQLNTALQENYPETSLRVSLQDTTEYSTYYKLYIEDRALNCEYHVLNVKQEVMDFLYEVAGTLTGLTTGTMSKGVLIQHAAKEVH